MAADTAFRMHCICYNIRDQKAGGAAGINCVCRACYLDLGQYRLLNRQTFRSVFLNELYICHCLFQCRISSDTIQNRLAVCLFQGAVFHQCINIAVHLVLCGMHNIFHHIKQMHFLAFHGKQKRPARADDAASDHSYFFNILCFHASDPFFRFQPYEF